MSVPTSYTNDDLQFYFFGGGSDAEYEFLLECYRQGITAQDLLELVTNPPGTGVSDHGALTGLNDDDHPVYLTEARSDARNDGRYLPIATVYETPTGAQAKADAKVENQILPGITDVAPSQGAVDAALATKGDNAALATKAPINSPAFTGTPTAPTPAPGSNDTKVATTAYSDTAIAALVGAAPSTLNTLVELANAINNDPAFYTTLVGLINGKVSDAIADGQTTVAPSQNAVFDALALKAPIASPVFTGTPSVPDDPYSASLWDGSVHIPTKNAVRDKIESIPLQLYGTVAAMPGVGTVPSGTLYYTTDAGGGTMYQAQGGAWVPTMWGKTDYVPYATMADVSRIPHSVINNAVALNGTTSSTAWVDTPVQANVTNFEKLRSDSNLVITLSGQVSIDDAFTSCYTGVLLSGAADLEMMRIDSPGVASTNHGFSATTIITGRAAGTIALIKSRWKVSAASVVAGQAGRWSINVTETW